MLVSYMEVFVFIFNLLLEGCCMMLVLKGLLYDLSLLQESASNSKDQKDEMVATIEALEYELTFKSGELAAVVANCQLLEAVFFHQMNDSIKKLSVDRDALSIQRDQLQGQVILLKESFEKAVAQAEAKKRLHKRLKRF